MLIYGFGAAVFGVFWLTSFVLDSQTPNMDVRSWILLLVAVLFWPITVPLSCLELLEKYIKSRKHTRSGAHLNVG